MSTFLVWLHGVGFTLFLLVYVHTAGRWLMTRDIIPIIDDDAEIIWRTLCEFGVPRVVAVVGSSLFWPIIGVIVGALELYYRFNPEDFLMFQRSKRAMDWVLSGFGKEYAIKTDDPFRM